MNKLYFNVTKIMNGWVVDYSPSFEEDGMTPLSQEKFLKTLHDVHNFIFAHTKKVVNFDSMTLRHLFRECIDFNDEGSLESSKRWINPVKGEDAFIIDLPNGKKIKVDGILENVEEIK